MQRTPEPELMDEAAQARAYAEADFAEPHQAFVRYFRERFADFERGHVLDLGCGPADVTMRFARAYPAVTVDDALISNSLLHHLADPMVLWETVAQTAKPGAPVFVMDLLRPHSIAEAERLTATHAADAPEILRKDFFNSLLAAYQPDEIARQLKAANLEHFRVEQVSDRHVVIWGFFR
jgi:SAM-dependent methyltransferase